MAAIRGKGTAPERMVRRLLKEMGVRFRSHAAGLPGTPDFVVPEHRVAIFVHGCFWHAHSCRAGRTRPRTRARFWREKLDANAARDRRVQRALRRAGWRVAVIWQCRLRNGEAVRARLSRLFAGRSLGGRIGSGPVGG